jgi:hypothetical protein
MGFSVIRPYSKGPYRRKEASVTYNSYTSCDGPDCTWQYGSMGHPPTGWVEVRISHSAYSANDQVLHFCSISCLASWLGMHHELMLGTVESRQKGVRGILAGIKDFLGE